MITLLVMTDGRADCITQAIAHADAYLTSSSSLRPITRRVIHDDSGDFAYRTWLAQTFLDFEILGAGPRRGFGGAIAHAWSHLASRPERFVFHLEDDFVIDRPVDLSQLSAVLDHNPHLAQLALRRQPWNDEERAAGGIVESHPDDYADTSSDNLRWLEHRRFFTTNPSLYRRSLCERGWPRGSESEGHFSADLFADPSTRCGFWGSRDSGEWCTHIGHERVGVGY